MILTDIAHATLDSPIGPLLIAATPEGVREVRFLEGASSVTAAGPRDGLAAEMAARTVRELREYFAGDRRAFEVPCAFDGTEFQRAVWQALRKIPFGETRAYADIAAALGNPKAVRAIGAANGANRIAVIVPCHRVIGAGGSLVGYAAGVERKAWLLHHERSFSAQRSLPLT